ncbi:hypothetical protein [Actinoplanes sp. CA-252034]|uniref:hypothetical protein n=1 Tax=Actinoplanes sp. CA-252034 TaxID=3239906 RepID=UPI003D98EB27
MRVAHDGGGEHPGEQIGHVRTYGAIRSGDQHGGKIAGSVTTTVDQGRRKVDGRPDQGAGVGRGETVHLEPADVAELGRGEQFHAARLLRGDQGHLGRGPAQPVDAEQPAGGGGAAGGLVALDDGTGAGHQHAAHQVGLGQPGLQQPETPGAPAGRVRDRDPYRGLAQELPDAVDDPAGHGGGQAVRREVAAAEVHRERVADAVQVAGDRVGRVLPDLGRDDAAVRGHPQRGRDHRGAGAQGDRLRRAPAGTAGTFGAPADGRFDGADTDVDSQHVGHAFNSSEVGTRRSYQNAVVNRPPKNGGPEIP